MTEPTTTRSPLGMTPTERHDLLAGEHTGIVVVARAPDRAPLATPVWYDVDEDDGSVVFVTGKHSQKATLIHDGSPISFLVQDENPPQRFVTVEGTASVSVSDDATRRRIAGRYLPDDAIDDFIAMTPSSELVAVTIRPSIWFSTDFAKLQPQQEHDPGTSP